MYSKLSTANTRYIAGTFAIEILLSQLPGTILQKFGNYYCIHDLILNYSELSATGVLH